MKLTIVNLLLFLLLMSFSSSFVPKFLHRVNPRFRHFSSHGGITSTATSAIGGSGAGTTSLRSTEGFDGFTFGDKSRGKVYDGGGGANGDKRDKYNDDRKKTVHFGKLDDKRTYNKNDSGRSSRYNDKSKFAKHRSRPADANSASYLRSKNSYVAPSDKRKASSDADKINLSLLAAQGYEHLYGVNAVLNALLSCKRDFAEEPLYQDGLDKVKPGPRLFLMDKGYDAETSKAKKRDELEAIVNAANELNVPITYLDKGTLNSLSSNRPTNGAVLRTRPFPLLKSDPNAIFAKPDCGERAPKMWIALDEVKDPQNLGAILRTAYFLSGPTVNTSINVLLCAKNSAPMSPVVSAASAGAMEIGEVYGVGNMPSALGKARELGWRILGAARENPFGRGDKECKSFEEYDPSVPTILVMGNEGAGLRTMVAKACDGFVKINGGGRNGDDDEPGGVDSLNVSVSAGILLTHFGGRKKSG